MERLGLLLHRASDGRLAPHFGAGPFSWPLLENPQSCDQGHTTARRRAVSGGPRRAFPHAPRPCVAGGMLGACPRSHFTLAPISLVALQFLRGAESVGYRRSSSGSLAMLAAMRRAGRLGAGCALTGQGRDFRASVYRRCSDRGRVTTVRHYQHRTWFDHKL